MIRNILCYGDSNTFGYMPGTGERYPSDIRYPGRLQKLLGNEYHVIEEGCCGRTTLYDDPSDGWQSGLDDLRTCLDMYQPVHLVILMLGTNDLKTAFHLNAEQIAESAGKLVDAIQSFVFKKQNFMPQIILVSPPEIGPNIRNSPFCWAFSQMAAEESKRFPVFYKAVADRKNCLFVNAAEYVSPSETDSLHLTAEGHGKLAAALYDVITNHK